MPHHGMGFPLGNPEWDGKTDGKGWEKKQQNSHCREKVFWFGIPKKRAFLKMDISTKMRPILMIVNAF